MNVLFVNHTGAMSGAERSLLDLLKGLKDDVDVRLACPPTGPLAGAARKLGVPVDEIPGTAGSLKLHRRETPVAVARLCLASALTAHYARRMKADVIHANSIRAGLVTVPAARFASASAVVHLRDRLPRSTIADASLWLIGAGAGVVAANSRYTADGLRAVTGRGRLRVVYNPVDLGQFDRSLGNRVATRASLGMDEAALVLAVIGQITPWKGQQDAVQVLAALRRAGRDVHLLIVGEPKFVSVATRYDNRAYYAGMEQMIRAEGVEDRVHLLGERADVPEIMGSLDVLLVPSWEEPFGRVVVEAMALGVPVVATNVGGPAEIISDNVDGILLAPRQPVAWTQAVLRLDRSRDLRASLAEAGIRRAQNFGLPEHVRAIRDLYEEVLRPASAAPQVERSFRA